MDAGLLTRSYCASVLADSTELAEFRRGFGAWLEAAGVRSRALGELLLAAHEAVAHAIRRSAPAGFIGVRGVLADGEVTIDVTSKGGWGEPGHRAEEQEQALALIRGLVDQLLISSDSSGTRLKMRRSLAQVTLMPALDPVRVVRARPNGVQMPSLRGSLAAGLPVRWMQRPRVQLLHEPAVRSVEGVKEGNDMNRKSLKRLLDRLLGAAKRPRGSKTVRPGLGEPQA